MMQQAHFLLPSLLSTTLLICACSGGQGNGSSNASASASSSGNGSSSSMSGGNGGEGASGGAGGVGGMGAAGMGGNGGNGSAGMAGAGGVGGNGGGGGVGNAGPTGVLEGAIQVGVMIANTGKPDTPTGNLLIGMTVVVQDTAGNGLTGAKVTVVPEGFAPISLPPDVQVGVYRQLKSGPWAPSYGVDIVHSKGSRKGIRLKSPWYHINTYEPAPSVGMNTTIKWAPNNDPIVTSVSVGGYEKANLNNTFSAKPGDEGFFDIPASLFVAPGLYSISLSRRAEISEAPGTSTQFVGWVMMVDQEDVSVQ